MHGGSGGDAERVLPDGFDGPPDVYYLEAAGEKLGGFEGEVLRYAGGSRGGRLVDVHALDRAAEGASGGLRWGWGRLRAADRVVEDEDFGCASSEGVNMCWLGL